MGCCESDGYALSCEVLVPAVGTGIGGSMSWRGVCWVERMMPGRGEGWVNDGPGCWETAEETVMVGAVLSCPWFDEYEFVSLCVYVVSST